MSKRHTQTTKILVPITLYNSYKRQSELYQDILKKKSEPVSTPIAGPPSASADEHSDHAKPPVQSTSLVGNGLIHNSSSDSDTSDSSEYDIEKIATQNEAHEGLQNKFAKAPPPVVHNLVEVAKLKVQAPTESALPSRPQESTPKKNKHEKNHEGHLARIWKPLQQNGKQLLTALENHSDVVTWNEQGDITIRGKKLNCQWKQVLPALLHRTSEEDSR